MKKSIICIAMALLLGFGLSAKEYHVAKTGSDQNEGSAESPFLTINKAAMILKPGDVVTVHEGVYREWVQPRNSGADTYSRIVYQAAPGEEVWIKGSEVVTGWKKEGKGDVWKVTLPNTFFKSFNPFAEPLVGDWLSQTDDKFVVGEVYINNKSLFQAVDIECVKNPVVSDRTKKPEDAKRTWYVEVTDTETTLWANFGPGVNPNKELVEVNARPAVFFPALPGYISFHPVLERYTPYHYPHSTKIVGVMNFPGGDDRYYNNLFTVVPASQHELKQAGTSVYDERPPFYPGIYRDMNTRKTDALPKSFVEQMSAGNNQASRFQLAMHVGSNLYMNGVKGYAYEENGVKTNTDAKVSIEKTDEGIVLKITVDGNYNNVKTVPVNTDMLGKTYFSNGYYENPDGTPLTIDKDLLGNPRSATAPKVGPFENLKVGENSITVWKFKK